MVWNNVLHVINDSFYTKLAGPLKRWPHEHLKTAFPQADVFNSVKVKCGSSKYNDGHWTGLQFGGGDDQLPINTNIYTVISLIRIFYSIKFDL